MTYTLSLSCICARAVMCYAQVTVVGAAGGIGQPMSLLLKLSGKIEHLSLFDIVNTPGVAADISHCDAKAKASKLSMVVESAAAAPRPEIATAVDNRTAAVQHKLGWAHRVEQAEAQWSHDACG